MWIKKGSVYGWYVNGVLFQFEGGTYIKTLKDTSLSRLKGWDFVVRDIPMAYRYWLKDHGL